MDINPHGLAAARDNAARNGVADRIEVRHRSGSRNLAQEEYQGSLSGEGSQVRRVMCQTSNIGSRSRTIRGT